MIAGFAGFAAVEEAGGRPRRVIGIDASAAPERSREQIGRVARKTASLIGVERELWDQDIGHRRAISRGNTRRPGRRDAGGDASFGPNRGTVTDPGYEGKPMAGMTDLVTRGEIGSEATVLHARPGGRSAPNAYSALF